MVGDTATARSRPALSPGLCLAATTTRSSSVVRAAEPPQARVKIANGGVPSIDTQPRATDRSLRDRRATDGAPTARSSGIQDIKDRYSSNRWLPDARLPDRCDRAGIAGPSVRKRPMTTAAMSGIVGDFIHDRLPGRIVFGAGASGTQLASELERLNVATALALASPSQVDVADELVQQSPRGSAGVVVLDSDGIASMAVSRAAECFAQGRADCLLAVGGGSVMRAAKETAAAAAVPLVAVPTTYSGAELRLGCDVPMQTDATAGSARLLPRVVVYDPQLTFSLPDQVTGASAMTALANGIEALCAPGANPVSTLLAEEGLRKIADGSPDAVLHPHGLVGRSKTQYGGYLTGAAFATTLPGMHHKLCRTLADVGSLRRTDVHAVMLPHSLAVKRVSQPHNLARIAAALGRNDAAQGVRELACDVGAPMSLKELGMDVAELDALTASLSEETEQRYGLEPGALAALLTNAYHGATPDVFDSDAERPNLRRFPTSD